MIKYNFKRSILSREFIIAIAVFSGISFLSAISSHDYDNSSIYYVMCLTFSSVECMIIFSFVTFPSSISFIEDFEYKNFHYQIVRSGLKSYVFSKVLNAFLTPIIGCVTGFMTYIFILRIAGFPWIDDFFVPNAIYGLELEFLIIEGRYVEFYLIMAVQYGLLCGILGMAALFVSLFVKNKMFVVVLPTVLAYLLKYYLPDWILGNEGMNIVVLFNATFNFEMFGVDNMILVCVVLSFISFVLFWYLIYNAIRRRVSYE